MCMHAGNNKYSSVASKCCVIVAAHMHVDVSIRPDTHSNSPTSLFVGPAYMQQVRLQNEYVQLY
jgi:hypothetical protein